MSATLLVALVIPNCEGTEDADMVADEFVSIINEERDRNGGPQTAAERVGVSLFPAPQFVTAAQIQWLLDAMISDGGES